MKRLAFCLAPLLPALVHALVSDSEYHPLAMFVVTAVGLNVLLLAVGMPGHLLLRRSNRCGCRPICCWGFSPELFRSWLYRCTHVLGWIAHRSQLSLFTGGL